MGAGRSGLDAGSAGPSADPEGLRPSADQRPYLAQSGPQISSSVGLTTGSGSETQVTLIKCFQWMFSVVMLPPHVPHPNVTVEGMAL